jgi:hypothetical protein
MPIIRQLAAAAAATTLLALVACDLWVRAVRAWWDAHSLTGSVVSSLLVVAVTALIFDEVVARRQRKERAVAVAVQGLIVYGQARRAYDAVVAAGDGGSDSSAAPDELRNLAAMVLSASSSLFEDPVARRFLTEVERFAGSMIRAVSDRSRGVATPNKRESLASEMDQLRVTAGPLLARIPSEDWSALEGQPGVTP